MGCRLSRSPPMTAAVCFHLAVGSGACDWARVALEVETLSVAAEDGVATLSVAAEDGVATLSVAAEDGVATLSVAADDGVATLSVAADDGGSLVKCCLILLP